jgi:hypothetical protein
MGRIKNPNHARAIRRGIEYARREVVAMDKGPDAYEDAMRRTERYRGYLGGRERKLFDQAWFETSVRYLCVL